MEYYLSVVFSFHCMLPVLEKPQQLVQTAAVGLLLQLSSANLPAAPEQNSDREGRALTPPIALSGHSVSSTVSISAPFKSNLPDPTNATGPGVANTRPSSAELNELKRMLDVVMGPVKVEYERERLKQFKGGHKEPVLKALAEMEAFSKRGDYKQYQLKTQEWESAMRTYLRQQRGKVLFSFAATAFLISMVGHLRTGKTAVAAAHGIIEEREGFNFHTQKFLQQYLAAAQTRWEKQSRAIDVLSYLYPNKACVGARWVIDAMRSHAAATVAAAGVMGIATAISSPSAWLQGPALLSGLVAISFAASLKLRTNPMQKVTQRMQRTFAEWEKLHPY